MRSGPPDVVHEVVVHLADHEGDVLQVHAVLQYDVGDPYAVSATFSTESGERVTWIFARDLLAHGMTGTAGLGAVRVWSSEPGGGAFVYLALTSRDGAALLEAPAGEVAGFLARTYQQCPLGDEDMFLDLDRLVERLLTTSR